LATVGEDNIIRIWDVATGDVLLSWTGHGQGELGGGLFLGTIAVDYSPDGTRLATAGTDGIAKVWDAATGEELLALAGHTYGLFSIAYSPDGRFLATGGGEEDPPVKVWDAVTGEEIHTLEGHTANVWGLVFSRDNHLLATSGFGGEVKLWDIATGTELYTLPSQVNTVATVALTPDEQRLITSGGDAVRVWDVATGTERLTLANGRWNIALTQDGRRLYASHLDGVVRVYTLLLEDAIALAHERLTRWWQPEECEQYLHTEVCPERP
jgi:WD40 repeat protein